MNAILLLTSALLFGAEYVIDVPEGQAVTNKTDVDAVTSGDTFVKTGKGAYVLAGSMKLGTSTYFGDVEVREGTLASIASSEIHQTEGAKITIAAGAKLTASDYTFGYGAGAPEIEIAEGGVLDMAAKGWLGSERIAAISGAGTILAPGVGSSAGVGPQLANFTGLLDAEGSGLYFNLGDSTAEHDVPYAQMKGLHIKAVQYDRFRFCLYNAEPATLQSVTGYGGYIEPYGDLTIGSISIANFSLHPYANLFVKKGRIGFYSARTNPNDIDMRSTGITLTFADGFYAALPGTGVMGYNKTTVRAYPGAIPFKTSNDSTLTLTNAACFRIANGYPKYVNVLDGSTLEMATINFFVGGVNSAESPAIVRLDGGAIKVLSDATYSGAFGRNYNGLKMVVGAKGGRIYGTGDCGSPTMTFKAGVPIEAAAGTAGAFAVGGRMDLAVNEPLALAGPVTLSSGTVTFGNTANMRASASVTGTGDLTLGNVTVSGMMTAGSPFNLGTAPGSKIKVTGLTQVAIGTSTGNRLTLGASDAASSPLSFEKGASLWLLASGVKTELLDGTTTKVVVNGGVPMRGPFVAQPIFLFNAWNGIWGGTPWPLKYDETNGFTEFKDYVNSLTAGADSVACIGAQTLSEDATVAGLIVTTSDFSQKFTGGPGSNSTSTGNPFSSAATLTIAEGATLTVGGSGGYALVIIHGSGDYTVSGEKLTTAGHVAIKGAGTLNFGASEGYITTGARGGGISCPIAGTAGITITGNPCACSDTWLGRGSIYLAGHSTYSGGTQLRGLGVRPWVDDAFGTGDVWISGDGSGSSTSQIRIDEGLDLTFTNGFHLAGLGSVSCGNIYATGKVRLTGPVEFGNTTRVTVRTAEGGIRFSGPLSGDSLQIWNANTNTWDASGALVKAYDAIGPVTIESSVNTMTGEITIVRSALKLAAGAKLGVKDLWLDDGLLEITANEDTSVGALIGGVGTVRLAGRANRVLTFPVRESDPLFLQQECVLDLNNKNRAVNSLSDFTVVTNSGTKAMVHLSVLDDAAGSFTGTVAPNVSITYGQVYRQGLTVLVR